MNLLHDRETFAAAWVAFLFLALATPALAQECVELPAGAIGWWPADGADSEVTSGMNARRVAGAGFVPGLVGDAFGLDGVSGGQDDRVLLPRLAADGLADLTVEFWVNTTDPIGGLVSAANGNPSSANELLLFQSAGGLVVWLKQTQSGSLPMFVNDGAWHHVALVREGALGALYLDGQLVDMRPYPEGPLDVGPLGLLLGQDQDCLGGCFQAEQALDGAIDELAIYGRALDDVEVAAIFAAGAAGKCKPAPTPDAPDVVELDRAIERIDALDAEMGLLIERLGEIDLAVETLESSLHSHERPGHRWTHPRWQRDRDDDRKEKRRHDRKRKRDRKGDDKDEKRRKHERRDR